MLGRRLSTAFAAVLLVSACAGAPAGSRAPIPSIGGTLEPAAASPASALPSPSSLPRTMAGRELLPCRIDSSAALCGALTVPENPTQPSGGTIDLRVVVVPASGPNPQPDPVFMLAGGPGGAAAESMGWTVTRFLAVHATRDIVLVDQRGTGGSNELWLPEPSPPAGGSTEAVAAYLERWAHDAFEALGADASTYTTSVAMDDLDAVRAALGYDRINLYGASYGATAAQYYVRQHPDRVRSVVLDGATLLDVPVMELIAASSQRALDLLLARCAADRGCSTAYPNLSTELSTTLRRLGRTPVDTGVPDPFGKGTIEIDRNGFAGAVHQGLIEATTAARLPWLIHLAATGEWAAVGRAIAATAQRPDAGILVMSGIIRCSEAWARFDPDETRRRSAGSYYLEAELAMARNQFAACPFAPKGIVPAEDGAPAHGDMPVLFLVGEADPQDPPENIADAASDFPNSMTVVVPGQGHTVGHLGCLPGVIDAFVLAGSTANLDTSCVGSMQPAPFQLP